MLAVAVLSIPTILLITINSKWVQNVVAQRVTAGLSEKLGNHVSAGDIRVSWFNRVTLHDLLVTDVRGDTILAADELIGRLNLLAFSSRNIEIRKVALNRADIRLAIDRETDEINIKFIVEQFKAKDTATVKPKWMFGIQSIELNDCRFSFRDASKPFDRPFGMDYADIEASNLDVTVTDFRPGDSLGGVAFRIRRLSCVEKCGLDLRFLSADFLVNKQNLSFQNVRAVTAFSEIEARDASFHFDSFQDFSGDNFISKVILNMDIRSSEVAFNDLSHFASYFHTYSDRVKVTGAVTGTVENLKGDGVSVRFGDVTYINGNFDLKGLPRIRSTLIYADVTELVTCPKDIERIQVARLPGGHVNLSPTIHRLDTIHFKGNFTGFFDDFVTYGKFTTRLGSLSTDVSIKPQAGLHTDTAFTFHGTLKTQRFHLGKLLTQPSIGEVTLTGMVEGSASGKGKILAQLEGVIDNIDLRGYEYRNISVNGAVNNRMYDGQLSIDEPNIKMDFSGKVDLTHTIPSYDFRANVERAKLHHLKLVKQDTSSFASFNIKAAFSGTNIDNLAGELELTKSMFRRNSREIEINNLELFTKAIRDTNRFILLSDILDAEIWGQYQFLKLPESFFAMVKNFAPAWAPISASPENLSNNNFRFYAKFKETEKLTGFFLNEFRVSPDAQIDGVYNPSQRDVHFMLNVPYMRLGEQQWRGFFMHGNLEDSTFTAESGCTVFRANRNMSFENLKVAALARGDSVGLDIRWNNWDSILYKGALDSKIFFLRKPNKRIPMIHIFSSPGELVTAGNVWKISHGGIRIDSTSVMLNRVRAQMDNQEIQLSGIISDREQDRLDITVNDLNLSAINSSLQFDRLLFGGISSGSASLSNLYKVPVFVADLQIDALSLNSSLFGSTGLKASWNSYNRSVHIEAESIRNDLRSMYVRGNYFITDQKLNFDVALEKIPAQILQPYLENIFTNTEGMLSSEVKLTGTINNPLLNGTIGMEKVALTLDYTKTRYSFSGKSTVNNNAVQFKNIALSDRFGNPCRITDGFIFFDHFKDISWDLQFQANRLEVLNTRAQDNSLFYGKAFATGNIRIKGNPNEIQLDIIAKTEKNTQFSIPLSASDEISQSTFIKFVDHTPRASRRPLELMRRRRTPVAAEEPVAETKFNVNITMDVTPEAEAQLIFDAKIGDVITARGSGNLKLNIANNHFDMHGTYTVDEGNYLFTLRNILTNKRFSIQKGGIITWNGDPMGALLNLKAVYTARPSLKDLMNDDNFNRTIPVECILHITNRLTNPNIRFELDIPNAGQEVRSFLSAATSTEEEKTRQIISLVAANRFFPDPNRAGKNGSTGSGFEMGLAAASEVLTSQFSHMLSQWSDGLDVEMRVRPGSNNSRQVYEGGISTEWVNFHANYEVGAETSENSGEFTIDVKLNPSGKLRLKAFRRTNPSYLSQSTYTQGIGLLFREDFNQFGDLFHRKKTEPAIRRDDDDETP